MMKRIAARLIVPVAVAGIWSCSSSSAPAPASGEKGASMKSSGSDFYVEAANKGRLYIFGTEKAYTSFQQSGQVPHIAKSYIGAGPDGQTVVLEADAKTTDLQDRLKVQYETKHGTKLP